MPSRRRFLEAVPAGLATTALTSEIAAAQSATPATGQEAAHAIDGTTLRVAQSLNGLNQSDDDLAKAIPLLTRYRDNYKVLRAIEVSHTTEPAFTFDPRSLVKPRAAQAIAPPTKTKAKPARPARVEAPGSQSDIAFASASQLRAWLDAKHIESAELVRLSLERLRAANEKLFCVVTMTDDRAAHDLTRAAQSTSPLRGIPWGVKDLFDSAGIRTTWGAAPYKDRTPPAADATAVQRLSATGAPLVAKLTTGELAIGDVWFGGKTRNPWDLESGASGSSAGSASAVAAGLVPFALGTETGGSVISPASTCGVVGLRPTYGRVSRHGVMTLRWTMDKVGVIARSAEDCGRVLEVIHGPDGLDRSVFGRPFSFEADVAPRLIAPRTRKLRLGIVERELDAELRGGDPKTLPEREAERAVFEAAIATFAGLGFEIVPVKLPDSPGAALYAIHVAESGAMFDDLIRAGRLGELAGQGPTDRSSQLRAATFVPATEYLRAQRIRTQLVQSIDSLFDTCDLFLAPPSSDSLNMTNLTGHPAITVRAGFVRREKDIEKPQNIMLTGRLDDEGTLIAAAMLFERATTAHARRPPLFA